MYTKRKGIRSKKHRHSAHRHSAHRHSAHRHSAHHRKTSKKPNNRRYKHKTRRTRNHHRHGRMKMSGGMASYVDAYIPSATNSFNNGLRSLGNHYDAGVAGQPSGNHYAYNINVKAAPMPSNHMAQIGGRKHKCKCKGKCKCKNKHKHFVQRGGGISNFITSILPEELVNVGRSVPASLGHLADKFNGELSHPSSRVYPTEQPHIYDSNDRGALINPNTMSMADIRNIYNEQNNIVSGI